MNLQPLYTLKERLEQAAIAGTGLLGEDFRLQRAAETLKPLAAASPVFAKLDGGLQALRSAPAAERGGLLLDLLALTNAVVYTQGKTGIDGDLEPLSPVGGTCQPISYGQMQPLITALTTTGGGRMEIIKSTYESHPEYFSDFRVLPALVSGLRDSYGEIAGLNAVILRHAGPAALLLLKRDFDPAGKREMARRVEVIAALEGPAVTPWLLEILPQAKKEVRTAVLAALGTDPANAPLLLDLVKTERGANRDAVLTALARQEGEAAQAFWTQELAQKPESIQFLQASNTDLSIALVTSGLKARLERFLGGETHPKREEWEEITTWCQALGQKDSPAMLDFWRWADEHMEAIDQIRGVKNHTPFLGVQLTDQLRGIMRKTGPGPLRDYCLNLWDSHPSMTRYLHISFQAALLSRPAAEVFEKYSPCLLAEDARLDAEHRKSLQAVLLRALGEVAWNLQMERYILDGSFSLAEPLDARWFPLLIRANGDRVLFRLIHPMEDPALMEQVGKYFHYQATHSARDYWGLRGYIDILCICGWTDWAGLLPAALQHMEPLHLHTTIDLLNHLPISAGEKAVQLQAITELVWKGSIKPKSGRWPDLQVRQAIDAWAKE